MSTEFKFNLPNISRRSFIRRTVPLAVGAGVLSNTIRDLRILNNAMAQSPTPPSDYKALICVFLNGGNDSNNMIIPTLESEWASYAAIRTPVLAIPNTDGSPATALAMASQNGQPGFPAADGRTYGFHPAMPEMRTLFNSGFVAPVFNVGSLSFPLTKVQYSSNSVPRPPQLFSHSDQQAQWQTSIPDQLYTSGWAGRMTDLLTPPSNMLSGSRYSMVVTLAGSNVFQVGNANEVPQYAITTSGAVTLSGITGARRAALDSILATDVTSSNLQTKAYSQILGGAISEAETLTALLNAQGTPAWFSNFPTNGSITTPNGGSVFNSGLMNQMRMVARLIEIGSRSTAAGGLGLKRQIFFIQAGGYDTHTNQTNNSGAATPTNARVIIGSHANLLAELSQSLNALHQSMTQIDTLRGTTGTATSIRDAVTAFTSSDFTRTFPCNGFGSDHGWGGHHIVMGGAVKGGATYGKFPTLTVGGPDDTSTGRWIPTLAVDQYAATLAKWFGVDSSNMSNILPNIGRFSTADIGFMG
jgi:uncharacterized protein (DUF1501 family)